MARSTRLVILIKNIYTLWGRIRFLLPVTYFPTNLVYPFTLRVTGIKSRQNSWAGKDKVELPRQSQLKTSKPNVYEVINNNEVREVVTLHVSCLFLRFFKHGKIITARYDVGDLYTNGTLDEMEGGVFPPRDTVSLFPLF